MASITDASRRSVRSPHSLQRDRMPSKVRLTWGLLAGALALAGLSCAELDPTGEDTGLKANISSRPGPVDDLRVLDVSDTAVRLVWTEVDDGLGSAATYQVRYAASPIGYGWGSATVASSGTCASPIDGVTVDSILECSIEGLDAESMYDFQLVAFRGTLNEDAVFGDLSNVASGTTEAPPGPPAQVTDLAVSDVSETGATLRFTEVDDGAGEPASYQVRYAPSPIGYGWGSATVVTEGSCASPVAGTAIDSTLTCTVDGLAASTDYDFQLVAFRGTLNEDAVFGELSNVASGTTAPPSSGTVAECANAAPEWIWCDDFEEDRLDSYFEYDDASGSFVRAAGVGLEGSHGMRVRWATGQVSAGLLHLAFGRTPQPYFEPVDAGTADYRDVYWRMYVRHAPDWVGGGGDKLSRATVFASSTSWAQAMIAHVWSGSSPDENYLVIDPASGTDEEGNLLTTTYNDFDNLRWLGAVRGPTPLFDAAHMGTWYCIEARARLNDAGASNGLFELWVDGELEARATDLNWLGSFDDYGINAIFFDNYWNDGSPADQERYFDDIVVSTAPIGCDEAPSTEPEADIAHLSVTPTADTLNAIGHTVQLTASALDAGGDPIADPDVAWASLDPTIATVDAEGLVISRATGTVLVTTTALCCATSADTARIHVRQVVASVAVDPSTASLTLEDSVQLTATALDSAGVAVPGNSFEWSSSDLAVVTVLSTGPTTALATPLKIGSATITARTGNTSAGVPVTVVSEPDTDVTNEPADFSFITARPFEAKTENGWLATTSSGFSIVSDATAPVSPEAIGQMFYPAGASGDGSYDPGWTEYSSSSLDYTKLYLSFWLKISANWQGHPVVNKVFYSWMHDNAVFTPVFLGEGADPLVSQMRVQDTPDIARNLPANLAGVPILRGVWQHWEIVLVSNTGGNADGEIHWWIDGTKVGEYRDVAFATSGQSKTWDLLAWRPIWGGQGDAIIEDMYMWMDHFYASGSP